MRQGAGSGAFALKIHCGWASGCRKRSPPDHGRQTRNRHRLFFICAISWAIFDLSGLFPPPL